jgi:anti-sigma-K factor RskA
VVELYVELDEGQAERFAAEVAKEGNEEVREMVITWEETLAANRAEGIAAATRNHILRILKQRFEPVPALVRQKLEAIQSLERLEGILDQAVVVRSVDDLVLVLDP